MSISDLPKALFRKWEHILFWGLAVSLVAAGLSWRRGLAEGEGSTRRPRARPRAGSLLDTDTAFAFRDSLEDTKLKDPHPFFAVPELDRGAGGGPAKSGTEKKPRRGWDRFRKRKRTPTTTTKPTPKVTRPTVVKKVVRRPPRPTPPKPKPKPAPVVPTVEPAPDPAPPKPTPPPKKKKVMRVIEHRGVVGTPSGKQFALVQEVNTKQIAYVEAGSTLGDFKVESFGNDSLQIIGPDGKTHSIAFGSQKKIVIE